MADSRLLWSILGAAGIGGIIYYANKKSTSTPAVAKPVSTSLNPLSHVLTFNPLATSTLANLSQPYMHWTQVQGDFTAQPNTQYLLTNSLSSSYWAPYEPPSTTTKMQAAQIYLPKLNLAVHNAYGPGDTVPAEYQVDSNAYKFEVLFTGTVPYTFTSNIAGWAGWTVYTYAYAPWI